MNIHRFAALLFGAILAVGPTARAQAPVVERISAVDSDVVVWLADARLYRSHDAGRTWSPVPGPGQPLNDVVIASGGAVMGGGPVSFTNTQCFSRLYRTADEGATWEHEQMYVAEFDETREGATFATRSACPQAGLPPAILRSTDGGGSWSASLAASVLSGFLGTAVTLDRIATLSREGGSDWAVFRSADGGATWTQTLTTGGPPPPPSSQRMPVALSEGGTFYAASGTDVYRLPEGVSVWEETAPLPAHVHDLTTAGGETLLVGTSLGAFVSPDAGATWVADGLAGRQVNEFAWAGSGVLLAATDEGVWRRTGPGAWEGGFVVTPAEPQPTAAEGTRLTIAPNPAAGAASLVLTLPGASASVWVALYDVLGRAVTVVHEGPLSSGTHRMAVDASALAPGVYVARAVAEGGAVTARLVLTR